MKIVSDGYKAIAESLDGSARYYHQILVDGVELTDTIVEFKYSHTCNNSTNFSVGNTASAMVEFKIDEPSINLENKEIEVNQGLKLADGSMEYAKLGKFKVLSPEIERFQANYQCVDAMTYKMATVYESTLTYPTTDIAILKEICQQAGIELANTDLVAHTIDRKLDNYTKREIIGFISQLQGKNAIINTDGKLELIWYTQTDYVVDDNRIYSDRTDIIKNENDYVLGYIKSTYGSKEVVSGDIDTQGIRITNPYMTQDILDEVFNKIKGLTFRAINVDFYGDFRLEVGDIVTVNTNNESYVVPIMTLEQSSDGGVVTSIESIGETSTQNSVDTNGGILNEIKRSVVNSETARTIAEQSADKINFIVEGDSVSEFTISDKALNIISENIDLTGKVTFNSLDSETKEVISGASDKANQAMTQVNKTVKSMTMHYLATTASSGVTTSTSGWTTTVQQIDATKKYLWTYQTMTYADGTTTDTTPVISGVYGDAGEKGAPGTNGKGISKITEYYQVSTSNTTAPTTWKTTVPTMTSTNKYLWNYETITYTDNTTTDTTKRVIGVYGATGASGKGISKIENYYLATSKSSEITTSTSGWTTTIQTITSTNKYLWNYEVVTYTDGSKTTTTPIIIGVYGEKGAPGTNGKGISKITEYYQVSTSNTTAPTTWKTTVPTMTSTNKYLWNYETITYTDNTTTDTTKRVIGVYGATGASGKGISKIENYYLATSKSSEITTSTSGWTTTIQTITSTNKYLWNYEVVTYTDGSKTTTTPIIIGVYGEKGAPGTSVSKVIPLFYLKSNTTAPSAPTSAVTSTATSSGVWTKSVPTYVNNYTYFTCTQTQYTNGNYGWSTVVADNALTNANKTATTANTNATNALNKANSVDTTLSSLCVLENNVTVIDGSKIYTGSITADKIDVNDLFAQTITAEGSITGAKLYGTYIESEKGKIGGFTISNKALYNGTSSKDSTENGVYLGTDGLRTVGNFGTVIHNDRISKYELFETYAKSTNKPDSSVTVDGAGLQIRGYTFGTGNVIPLTGISFAVDDTDIGYINEQGICTTDWDVILDYKGNANLKQLNVTGESWNPLTLKRTGSTYNVAIKFENDNGVLGYLTINTLDGKFQRMLGTDYNTVYDLIDASGGTLTGALYYGANKSYYTNTSGLAVLNKINLDNAGGILMKDSSGNLRTAVNLSASNVWSFATGGMENSIVFGNKEKTTSMKIFGATIQIGDTANTTKILLNSDVSISGNVDLKTTEAKNITLQLTNSKRSGALSISKDGHLGIWDSKFNNWMIYSDLKQNIVIKGNTSVNGNMSPTVNSNASAGYSLGSSNFRWKYVYAYSSSIQTSDRRYKENIEYINNNDVLSKFFDALRPCTYFMAGGDRKHIGFIAQDVEQIMQDNGMTIDDLSFVCKDPEYKLLDESKPDSEDNREYLYDENGEPLYVYGLKYAELHGLEVNEIQKLKQRVNDLEFALSQALARIDALESKLS